MFSKRYHYCSLTIMVLQQLFIDRSNFLIKGAIECSPSIGLSLYEDFRTINSG